jgi:hypothetical protein
VLPGAGHVVRGFGGGGLNQGDGIVHGIATLPLQVQDLGDAGLAGNAGFEVLQWHARLCCRASGVAEAAVSLLCTSASLAVDGQQGDVRVFQQPVCSLTAGDGGQQRLNAVDLAVGLGVVADFFQI